MALAPCRVCSRTADRPPLAYPGTRHVKVTSGAHTAHRYFGAPALIAGAGTDVVELQSEPIQPRVVGIKQHSTPTAIGLSSIDNLRPRGDWPWRKKFLQTSMLCTTDDFGLHAAFSLKRPHR